jgi:hypothetical protein
LYNENQVTPLFSLVVLVHYLTEAICVIPQALWLIPVKTKLITSAKHVKDGPPGKALRI